MNDDDDQRAERRVGSGSAPWDDSLDDYWPEETAESTSETSDPHPEFAVGMTVTDFATVDVTVRKRGEGAMGLVLCGPSARRAGNWIALKVLLPEHSQEPAFRDAYEREAITWCHVWPHRCIVTANGLTRLPTRGRQPALILTYASEGTLREQLERAHVVGGKPIPLARAFAWAQHVASALVAIHAPDSARERSQPLARIGRPRTMSTTPVRMVYDCAR